MAGRKRPRNSSDPEEGGEIRSSDPEEGGEIQRSGIKNAQDSGFMRRIRAMMAKLFG